MKIVVAPDSFKGSLTSVEACRAIESGIKRVIPNAEVVSVPMADGGEGTVEPLVDSTQGKVYRQVVTDPLGKKVTARYGVLGNGNTAVIEMAEASGLTLVPADARNPAITTSYGTGELIVAALELGCRNFIIGLGGSATNDGGVGMLQALGARFYDANERDLPFGGGSLVNLRSVDLTGMDARLQDCSFTVACDVDNPLCGDQGASHVFGPQKGATPSMVIELDGALSHYADVIESDLGISLKSMPGAGAAGGMGAAMLAFLGAKLRSGIEIVMEATNLKEKMKGANLVITGEGQCDFQSERGKAPFGVTRIARGANVPVIWIVGSIGSGAERLYEHGVQSIFSIVDCPMSLETAMKNGAQLLANAAERVMRALVLVL